MLDTKSYQFDESKGKIIAQEGDAITVQLYTNALSKETITLKAYLERYVGTVQRFFTVKAGAELSAYEAVASDHPVFELSPA